MDEDLKRWFPAHEPPAGGAARLMDAVAARRGGIRPWVPIAALGLAAVAVGFGGLSFHASRTPPPALIEPLAAALQAPPEASSGGVGLRALPSSNPRVRFYRIESGENAGRR